MSDPGQHNNAERMPVMRGAGPGLGGAKINWDYQAIEDCVAELGLKTEHVAEYFECSRITIERRLRDDPQFIQAYERGISRFRIKVSQNINRHAEKNAIVALAQANQPHILGWTNGRTEVTGKIEHEHNMSPAMMTFARRRESGQLSGPTKHNDLVNSHPTHADAVDADVIEVKGERKQ